jgi:hypothetical protein
MSVRKKKLDIISMSPCYSNIQKIDRKLTFMALYFTPLTVTPESMTFSGFLNKLTICVASPGLKDEKGTLEQRGHG